MKKLPAWATYTVLRLLLIAVPLAILLLVLPLAYWPFSVVAAVLIGMSLSLILLRRQREAMSSELYERRRGRVAMTDESAEDGASVTQPSQHPEGEPGSER